MVATSPAGATILEIFNIKIRIKEVIVLFLLWSILLNVFLVTRLHNIESQHSVHDFNVNSQSANFRSDRNVKFTKLLQDVQLTAKRKENGDNVLLRCESFGGPAGDAATDIVYWKKDAPSKQQFHSIYENKGNEAEKYFIYEPDGAGFSNVRISFETVVALAKATGRTLVLSPKTSFSHLEHQHPEGVRSYLYTDYFDISNIPFISMEEYLNRVAMKGRLRTAKGEVTFPPYNRTNWDDRLSSSGNAGQIELQTLFNWLSESMLAIDWNRDQCIIPFPLENDPKRVYVMDTVMKEVQKDDKNGFSERISSYTGNPVPVNSTMPDRLREMLAYRNRFCTYNATYQEAQSIYLTSEEKTGSRPLIQFFAYFFFESWEQDLQMKRFIRDHLRFSDIIQCAAARIVEGIREIASKVGDGNNDRGGFDTMHIRRNDFKGLFVYKDGILEPDQIVTDQYFESQRTVYIATDENDKAFFEPLHRQHTILFLQDFDHLIKDIDPNYYGMIEQLVCAKGDKFVGTYYSTFSAYINRVRGYHAQKSRSAEALIGSINSEYMGHNGNFRDVMKVSPTQYVSHFLRIHLNFI
jgi:GDP-fucose protein O-fucosyltransferase